MAGDGHRRGQHERGQEPGTRQLADHRNVRQQNVAHHPGGYAETGIRGLSGDLPSARAEVSQRSSVHTAHSEKVLIGLSVRVQVETTPEIVQIDGGRDRG